MHKEPNKHMQTKVSEVGAKYVGVIFLQLTK
jgi:hypothetical protein